MLSVSSCFSLSSPPLTLPPYHFPLPVSSSSLLHLLLPLLPFSPSFPVLLSPTTTTTTTTTTSTSTSPSSFSSSTIASADLFSSLPPVLHHLPPRLSSDGGRLDNLCPLISVVSGSPLLPRLTVSDSKTAVSLTAERCLGTLICATKSAVSHQPYR
ncbi:unnamed protein product [Hydatigera taeniaeformis]|uniref:Uncharacterized protein n=1 Tax=Hydatigena taeniaeformis TaxID=6205 RepID=A0A0R3XC96_HYDTA|nr:unnamed protein product [Hydatigera taeniaeformis]